MAHKVRVLIVDDSSFFRSRIRRELERSDQITVAGEASNGREAVDLATRLRPDLITMDVAMPEMDGIAAVREIMQRQPTDVIMFSALTRDGARATLEAMDAGAVDFLPKQRGLNGPGGGASDSLRERVLHIAHSRSRRRTAAPASPVLPAAVDPSAAATPAGRPRLVVIGASTGGPVALQRVLTALPADYPYPVLVAVHMPAEFTATFAERLDVLAAVRVRQATDGDELVPGQVLIAPGGMQAQVAQRAAGAVVRIRPGGDQLYRPSVDILFGSAARVFGAAVQAVVLTGMGADGTEGARLLKARGASVWSQDQASSVVYGMPYSVVKAGHSDRVLALDDIGAALRGLA